MISLSRTAAPAQPGTSCGGGDGAVGHYGVGGEHAMAAVEGRLCVQYPHTHTAVLDDAEKDVEFHDVDFEGMMTTTIIISTEDLIFIQ